LEWRKKHNSLKSSNGSKIKSYRLGRPLQELLDSFGLGRAMALCVAVIEGGATVTIPQGNAMIEDPAQT
jgi:hypothetical protein